MRGKPIVFIAGCLDADADRTMTFTGKMVLESMGYAVIDEYDLPRDKGLTQAELQRFGNAALGTCDIACFLPGWNQNPTAVRERTLCRHWNKTKVDYVDFIQRNEQMQDITNGQDGSEEGLAGEDMPDATDGGASDEA